MITNNYSTLKSDLYKLRRKTEDGVVNSTWKRSERSYSSRIVKQSSFKKNHWTYRLERAFQEGRIHKGMKKDHIFIKLKVN